jgi:hypothetical protein
VLATVTSCRGSFGLRYNPAPHRHVVVSSVDGIEWMALAERDLGDECEPSDPEFLDRLVGLIGAPADHERLAT